MGISDLFKIKGWKKSNHSPVEKWEVQSAIKECCKKKITASIHIDGYALDFLSMFIHSKEAEAWVMMDLLVPHLGNQYMERSRLIRVSYNLGKVDHSFRSSFMEVTKKGYRAIKIAYPEKIEKSQRREYFRVEPALEDAVLVSARGNRQKGLEIKGPLRDISEGGLSFSITAESAEKIVPGNIFTPVIFSLPGRGDFETKGAVRNVFEGRDDKFNCGIEFINLNKEQLSRIYMYVVERQRDAMKRTSKVKAINHQMSIV